MHAELAYQSRQSEKITQRNKALVDENAELRRRVELAKQTEVELAKRSHVYQKTIKTLLAKVKQESEGRESQERQGEGIRSQQAVLEGRVHALEITCVELRDAAEAAREHARRVEELHDRWLQRQGAAGQYLMQVMEDFAEMQPELPEAGAGRALAARARETWETMTAEDRTEMVQRMLQSLRAATVGPDGEAGAGVDRLVLPPVGGATGRSGRGTEGGGGAGAGGGRVSLSRSMPARGRVATTNKWLKGERGSEAMYGSVSGVDDLLAAVTSGKADLAILSMRQGSRPGSSRGAGAGGLRRMGTHSP